MKSVAFDENNQYLITGGNEKIIRVYDLNQPEVEPTSYTGHGNLIDINKFTNKID